MTTNTDDLNVRPHTVGAQYPSGIVVYGKSLKHEWWFPNVSAAAQIRDSINYHNRDQQRAAEHACQWYTYH